MNRLAQLQQAFRDAVLGAPPARAADWVRADRLGPEQRLQIYRNNAVILLTEALRANFPATCRLVDERFFAMLAARFIAAHPPRQPRLAEYGAELPDFLEAFEPAKVLPYLPDLARLEHAICLCLEAPDAPPLTAGHLASMPAETAVSIGFRPHPACRLLASAWPVDLIRRYALADGNAAPPVLEDGPVRLLLRRQDEDVLLSRLSRPHFALIEALFAGLSLAEAMDRLPMHRTDDTARLLGDALRDGLFAAPPENVKRP